MDSFSRNAYSSLPCTLLTGSPGPEGVLRVGLVGAGLIGSRRASVIREDPSAALVMVADVQLEKAREAALRWGAPDCQVTFNWQDLVSSPAIEVVMVSTINKSLYPVTVAALQSGKHVLCEKPMGKTLTEAKQMAEAAQNSEGSLR